LPDSVKVTGKGTCSKSHPTCSDVIKAKLLNPKPRPQPSRPGQGLHLQGQGLNPQGQAKACTFKAKVSTLKASPRPGPSRPRYQRSRPGQSLHLQGQGHMAWGRGFYAYGWSRN